MRLQKVYSPCSKDFGLPVSGQEIKKIYSVGHFYTFGQVSLIIVRRVLTVEWDHSFS